MNKIIIGLFIACLLVQLKFDYDVDHALQSPNTKNIEKYHWFDDEINNYGEKHG